MPSQHDRARYNPRAVPRGDAAIRSSLVLDRVDGDPDLEDGADAEPSLAAPENHDGTQVGWCRGNDQDREAEAPEPVLPEVAIVSPVPKVPAAAALAALAWGGNGNVISAAGVALLDLIERVG